jgi:hypothetical protein
VYRFDFATWTPDSSPHYTMMDNSVAWGGMVVPAPANATAGNSSGDIVIAATVWFAFSDPAMASFTLFGFDPVAEKMMGNVSLPWSSTYQPATRCLATDGSFVYAFGAGTADPGDPLSRLRPTPPRAQW